MYTHPTVRATLYNDRKSAFEAAAARARLVRALRTDDAASSTRRRGLRVSGSRRVA